MDMVTIMMMLIWSSKLACVSRPDARDSSEMSLKRFNIWLNIQMYLYQEYDTNEYLNIFA